MNTIEQEETVKGYWWLPNAPEVHYPGEVTYSPTTGAKLELYEALIEPMGPDRERSKRFTIYGKTRSGTDVSLFACHITNLTNSSSGFGSTSLFAECAVFGEHFSNLD